MTKEALKLALEALQKIYIAPEHEEYIRVWWPTCEQAITAIKEALAQPEQEPVAWIHNHIKGNVIAHRPATLDRHPDHWTALYPEPKPCPTCEALARTVMLDQTSHDTTPPQRKPLADAMEYDLDWCDEAAAELRRMHDLLGKANALCRIRAEEIERLKAQSEQEPVAKMGMYEHKCPNVTGHRGPSFVCQKAGHGVGQNSYCKGCTCPEALNTSPSAQRKPLTDEQILHLVDIYVGAPSTAYPLDTSDWLCFARAIEQAHGIKEIPK